MVVFQSLTLNHARTHDSIINLGAVCTQMLSLQLRYSTLAHAKDVGS